MKAIWKSMRLAAIAGAILGPIVHFLAPHEAVTSRDAGYRALGGLIGALIGGALWFAVIAAIGAAIYVGIRRLLRRREA